ncbi:MAG: DNA polymerase III subunit alpha, partial [Planctomycetota bacterium]
KLEFGKYRVPLFKTDDGEAPEVLFDRLCEQGLARLYGSDHAAARSRMQCEQAVIRQMGFVSYFLIVWDLIRWSRENGIPVGPGRGSAAGAIVAYLLGITKVDPLKYDLLFERFLNSGRASMPDIDIDFCKEGRERVLEYTRTRYGTDHVAQIVTFGTMASRTVVRDVARVLDLPLSEVDRLTKKIPAGPNAPTLAEALETDKELAAARDEKPEYKEIFELSTRLEGMARHISTHAAGVVISDRPIVEYVPLCRHDDDVVTQWPAPQLEELGLVKMDYLGLRTLTILERALRNIAKLARAVPDLDRLPENDPATYRMLTAGDTAAVFQLESEGMRKLLTRLKPDVFEDLIAVLALYRPGPLESGMVDMFTDRKHGKENIEYQHPLLEPILRDTYGCLVYQEQVMLISSALAGFTLNEADNLRKAMGKKKPEIMQKFAEQFVRGAAAKGASESTAREIWDNIIKFGGYGFNKSHSTAYALITYQTAYLKANHRAEFLAANFSCEMGNSDKVKELVDAARKSGVKLLPPDMRVSGWEFEPEGEAIRFGLGAIKGTGQKAVQSMLAVRDRVARANPSFGLHEICAQTDPQDATKLTWEALIKAGAFEYTGHNRGAVLAALEAGMSESQRAAADRRAGQISMFDAPSGPKAGARMAVSAGDGIDDALAFNKAETLRAEHDALGFYLSGHPLEERAGLFALLSNTKTSELGLRSAGSEVMIAGLIVGLAQTVVKTGTYAGKKMARFRLEDLEGNVQVTVFPRTFEQFRHLLADDTVVLARGKLDERGEEPALILEELMTIEDALKRFDGGLVVAVGPEDGPHLEALRSTLKRHPGKRPLFLLVTGDDGNMRRVRAGTELYVDINATLAEEVDRLLGKSRVRLARL